MPLVKPMTTGRGRYLTDRAHAGDAEHTSITPAIIVHMYRPSTP